MSFSGTCLGICSLLWAEAQSIPPMAFNTLISLLFIFTIIDSSGCVHLNVASRHAALLATATEDNQRSSMNVDSVGHGDQNKNPIPQTKGRAKFHTRASANSSKWPHMFVQSYGAGSALSFLDSTRTRIGAFRSPYLLSNLIAFVNCISFAQCHG